MTADLEFHAWPPEKRGGQQVADLRAGVLVIHRPTGLAVVVDEARSRIKNKAKAEALLREVLVQRGHIKTEPLDPALCPHLVVTFDGIECFDCGARLRR